METAVHPEHGQGEQRDLAGDLKRMAHDEGKRAAERGGALWEDAKGVVRARVNEQQQAAAKGVTDIAGALRTAAHDLEGREQQTIGRFANYAADGLEQLSGRLRNQDIDGMVREVERFARAQPVAFFGAALAVGFLAVRFLKSGQDTGGVSQAPANESVMSNPSMTDPSVSGSSTVDPY